MLPMLTPVLPCGLMFVVLTKMFTPVGTLLKVAFRRVPKSARPAVAAAADRQDEAGLGTR